MWTRFEFFRKNFIILQFDCCSFKTFIRILHTNYIHYFIFGFTNKGVACQFFSTGDLKSVTLDIKKVDFFWRNICCARQVREVGPLKWEANKKDPFFKSLPLGTQKKACKNCFEKGAGFFFVKMLSINKALSNEFNFVVCFPFCQQATPGTHKIARKNYLKKGVGVFSVKM